MQAIKKDWYIIDNQLSLSLIRYFLKITICKNDYDIYFRLEVYENSKVVLTFNFYSLEEAICFAEETIQKCNSVKEIADCYTKQWQTGKLKRTKNKKLV